MQVYFMIVYSILFPLFCYFYTEIIVTFYKSWAHTVGLKTLFFFLKFVLAI